MKFSAAKKALVDALARAAAVAPRKSTMPLLQCVHLSATAGHLTLSATDLYISFETRLDATVKKASQAAVPAVDLLDRVKMMPDGPIDFAVTDTTLTLKAPGTARTFKMAATLDGYPDVPRPDADAPVMTISASTLASLIERVGYAVSTDETRPQLNSALFEWDGDVVRMVATDGHRMAMQERTTGEHRASARMLLQLKALHELKRTCERAAAAEPTEEGKPSPGGQIEIVRSDAMAWFRTGATTFGAKLVDAVFPPWQQVVPKSFTVEVTINRGALADAVKAVAVSSDTKSKGVLLAFTKGKCAVHAESPMAGAGSDEVECSYVGAGLKIAFQAQYLIETLTSVDTDDVTLSLSGDLDPMRVTAEGAPGLVAIVMPQRQ